MSAEYSYYLKNTREKLKDPIYHELNPLSIYPVITLPIVFDLTVNQSLDRLEDRIRRMADECLS